MWQMKGAGDIPIKENVKPVIQPYRRIPVALEKIVDKKVEELLKQEIIEPTRWISPVVLSKQNNNFRFSIDMRRANQAIEKETHPLPTIEQFCTEQPTGAK